MKVLTIGRDKDKKIFEEDSALRARVLEYGAGMDELHITIFTLKSDGVHSTQISPTVFVHPTNSSSRWFFVFDAVLLGRKILKQNKFTKGQSVITCQDPFETGIIGYVLSKIFHFPLQLQVHTDFLSPYFKNSILNYIRVWVGKFLVQRAQGVRVVSTSIRDSLVREFPHVSPYVDVLPIFVDIQAIENAIPKKNLREEFPQFDFVVFMGSRLTQEKRIDVALRTFEHVVKKFPRAGLVISGSGPEKNNLEKLSYSLDIAQNVVFVGWQQDLISYYKSVDIFLLTSEYEGYGMTLIEAAASGCPIVTTRVGIASTDLFRDGENCFVCSVGDIESLTKALIRLLSDPDLRELFKTKMQDSIRLQATSHMEYTDHYLDLLRKLL